MSTDWIAQVGTQHITLSERVYQELRSAIIYRRIPPGQQLRSEELSRRMGVSRTPVKEALSRLRVEGLVDYTERHGFTVVKVNPADLPAVYDAQLMLQLNSIETGLPTASDEDIRAVKDAAAQARRLREVETPDVQALYDADRAFHQAVVAIGKNEVAVDWFNQLNAEVQGVRIAFLGNRSREDLLVAPATEHQAIVEAIERRDVLAAMEAVKAHFANRLERHHRYSGV